MNVLITGFEPFGGSATNSSWEVASAVSRVHISGVSIEARLLPVSFGRVGDALKGVIAEVAPDILIMLGQSGQSESIRLERIAINMMDSSKPDNDGYVPDEEVIHPDGPSALFATLPLKPLRNALVAQGHKVKISNSAGLYVCNRTYYEALYHLSSQGRATRAVFVHLPKISDEWPFSRLQHTVMQLMQTATFLKNNLPDVVTMTLLDHQMKNDLEERLSGKSTISAAENIAMAIKDDVSAKGLPSYFFGDRDAKTVVVNLNPGEAADICDREWKCRTEGFGGSLDGFIEKYIERQRTYGIRYGLTENGKADPFDVKQAAFLTPWVGNGIGLASDPDWNNEQYRLEAKTKVICNKLQLELVPYASAKFAVDKDKIALFHPFVETLLDEIFSKERKYLIFASALFEDIFKDYNKACPDTFDFSRPAVKGAPLKPGGKLRGKCRVITIRFRGKSQKALIAHTFSSQALGRAFDLMQKYGEMCFSEYNKFE